MRKLLVAAVASLGTFTAHAGTGTTGTSNSDTITQERKMAPDFDVKDTNNNPVKLSDFKGKVVVLEWTNAECPFVRKHYDTNNMQDLQKNYTDQGVTWVSIISSAPEKQGHKTADEANEQVKKDKSHPTHVVLDSDGKIGMTYEAKTTPHMFVIDKEGKIAYAGAIDDNPSSKQETVKDAKNYVAEALDAVLEDKKVPTTQTTAYGCTIKYADVS